MFSYLIFCSNEYLYTLGTLFLIFEISKNFKKIICGFSPNVHVVCTFSCKYFMRQKVLIVSNIFWSHRKIYISERVMNFQKKVSKNSTCSKYSWKSCRTGEKISKKFQTFSQNFFTAQKNFCFAGGPLN